MPLEFGVLAIAAVLIAFGIRERAAEKKKAIADAAWLARATKTEGVISRRKVHGGEYSRNKELPDPYEERHAVVRFRAADKVEYEFDARSDLGKTGDLVPVAYNPDLPSDAREIGARNTSGGCAYLLFAIALALVMQALFSLYAQ